MIEIIYNEESREDTAVTQIKLPRNVRQIGNVEEYRKIYVEDYVMTYISKLWEQPKEDYLTGVLLGEVKKSNEITYLFISGAVRIYDIEKTGKGIRFSDETWTGVYETMKQYFNELEIVGWFLVQNDTCKETDSAIYQTHIDNFGGIDKVLLLADITEKEEEFYVYESNSLSKTKGYYIYYEKNESMQDYMVEQKQGRSVESDVDDKAAHQYRTMIQEKKETGSQKRVVAALYSVCTCLTVVVLAIGVVIMNNYDKMKSMEQNVNSLAAALLREQTTKENEDAIAVGSNNVQAEKTVIERIDGEVETSTPAPESTPAESAQTAETEPVTQAVTEPVTESIPETTQPETTSVAEASQMGGIYHTVKAGETLSSISIAVYKSDRMVEIIKEANGIENQDVIYEGQRLYLP